VIDTYNIYFSFKVAINSLMRILRDPSLASYHLKVVGSLMFIFKVCKHEKDTVFCVFFLLSSILFGPGRI